jgi:hypothetical protein
LSPTVRSLQHLKPLGYRSAEVKKVVPAPVSHAGAMSALLRLLQADGERGRKTRIYEEETGKNIYRQHETSEHD